MSRKQSTGILHLCNLPGSCIKSQPLQIICWDIYCMRRNPCKQFCTKSPVAELSAHPLRCTAVSRALRLLSPPAADIARGQVGLIATVCNAPSEAQASCCNVPVMPPPPQSYLSVAAIDKLKETPFKVQDLLLIVTLTRLTVSEFSSLLAVCCCKC